MFAFGLPTRGPFHSPDKSVMIFGLRSKERKLLFSNGTLWNVHDTDSETGNDVSMKVFLELVPGTGELPPKAGLNYLGSHWRIGTKERARCTKVSFFFCICSYKEKRTKSQMTNKTHGFHLWRGEINRDCTL